ncbi:TniQ family protein [Desulfocurvibacter africanus]|nr:TniQ family protein [Desulfocurvibacter africanus]
MGTSKSNFKEASEALALMPPRTQLYHLEPYGLGTPYREGLLSYFHRLAHEHSMTPRVLSREIVIPRILELDSHSRCKYRDVQWSIPFFHGMGTLPQAWINILNNLTGNGELEWLTLRPFRNLISNQCLINESRQWCFKCIQDGIAAGRPYGQLLWTIRGVNICTLHQVRLVSQCVCGNLSSVGGFKYIKTLPWVCPHCGRELSRPPKEELPRVTSMERRYADVMLDFMQIDKVILSSVDGKAAFSNFIKNICKKFYDGKYSKLSNILNIGKSTMHGWYHGLYLPTISQMIYIAMMFDVTLSEIFTVNASISEKMRKINVKISIDKRIKCVGTKNIDITQELLDELLNNDTPLSQREAAKKLDCSEKYLRENYPQFMRSLSSRYRVWRKSENIKRKFEYELIVQEIVNRLLSQGHKPTFRRVLSEIGEKISCKLNWMVVRKIHSNLMAKDIQKTNNPVLK